MWFHSCVKLISIGVCVHIYWAISFSNYQTLNFFSFTMSTCVNAFYQVYNRLVVPACLLFFCFPFSSTWYWDCLSLLFPHLPHGATHFLFLISSDIMYIWNYMLILMCFCFPSVVSYFALPMIQPCPLCAKDNGR